MVSAGRVPVRLRRVRRWLVVAVLAQVLTPVLAACGSSDGSADPEKLFQAYLESTDVGNDEFSGSATSADRRANFASYFTRVELEGFLFSAYRCETALGKSLAGGFQGQLGCPPGRPVGAAAARFAPATLYERNVLVRRHGGKLELMPLYVAVRPGGAAVLIDGGGRTYPGGLGDFRRHNGLLSSGDRLLVPDHVTDTAHGGRLVVVSGHTPSTPAVPVAAALGGLAVLAGVVVFVRARRGAGGAYGPGRSAGEPVG